MTKVRITMEEIDVYKREILETTVLVSKDAAAVMLAVHPRTIERMVEEKRLTPYNDGQRRNGLRFLASDLQSYVREMRLVMRNG